MIIPVPTPVLTVTYKTFSQSFAAPISVSARAAAFASFSTFMEMGYKPAIICFKFLCQKAGKLGGFNISPVIGFKGPGQQTPIPQISDNNKL